MNAAPSAGRRAAARAPTRTRTGRKRTWTSRIGSGISPRTSAVATLPTANGEEARNERRRVGARRRRIARFSPPGRIRGARSRSAARATLQRHARAVRVAAKPPRRRRRWRHTPRRCPAARPGTTRSRRRSSWRTTGRTRPGRRRLSAPPRGTFAATTRRRRTKRRTSPPRSEVRVALLSAKRPSGSSAAGRDSPAWTTPTAPKTTSRPRRSSSAAARTRS